MISGARNRRVTLNRVCTCYFARALATSRLLRHPIITPPPKSGGAVHNKIKGMSPDPPRSDINGGGGAGNETTLRRQPLRGLYIERLASVPDPLPRMLPRIGNIRGKEGLEPRL